MSCVYFAWPDSGKKPEFIKIGYSSKNNPEDRIKTFRTGSPFEFIVVYQVGATKKDESSLHARFTTKEGGGKEWFKNTVDLWSLILGIKDGKLTIQSFLRKNQTGETGKVEFVPKQDELIKGVRVSEGWSRKCPRCTNPYPLTFRQTKPDMIVRDQPCCPKCRAQKKTKSSTPIVDISPSLTTPTE